MIIYSIIKKRGGAGSKIGKMLITLHKHIYFLFFFFFLSNLASEIEYPISVSLEVVTTKSKLNKIKINALKVTQYHRIRKPLNVMFGNRYEKVRMAEEH